MRRGDGVRLFAVAAIAGLLATSGSSAVKPANTFALIERRADGWMIEVRPKAPAPSYIPIDGIPHLLFEERLPVEILPEGGPLIPYETLSLGIPPGARISVTLLDPVYETQQGQHLAPRPAIAISDEGEAILSYRKSASLYGQDRLFPASIVSLDSVFTLRHQRIATVRVAAMQYNPVRHELRRLVSARLEVRLLAGAGITPEPGRAEDPHFEDVYKNLLANYEEARAYRLPRAQAPTTVDTTGDWFERGLTYYRVPVARDAWYRIRDAELQAAGGSLGAIDPSSLRLYRDGRPVPLLFRPDSAIEFHGRMKYGETTYADTYSDTSSYWLTWGGSGTGEEYRIVPSSAAQPDTVIETSRVTRHFEENTDYYEGTGYTEVIDNEEVPGEGWVWDYYYPGSILDHAFQIDSHDTAGSAGIRVRLYSTTLNYNTPDHHARFLINDTLIGESFFNGRQEEIFSAEIPTGVLREGSNTFRIESVPTASVPNQFYLDWFEIDYHRINRASAGQLELDLPPTGGVAAVSAGGFPDAEIDVYDIVEARRIVGGEVTPDGQGGYQMIFRDTLDRARSYLLVSSPSDPLPLQAKVFRDLRANALGADYIVITHGEFLESAIRLAAHRQQTNQVRSLVVDIRDIYDEFNYGHAHTRAIKDFLTMAYTTWPAPVPAYVLIFGDASWDYHQYMTTTVKKNYVPAYGVPAADNWFVSFDSVHTFLPSMIVGRIPVENPVQAARTVDKIIGYDGYLAGDWNKDFLFITGGTSPTEQASFNGMTELLIQAHVNPAPVGGTALRVYKDTPDAIDGENRELLRSYVKRGLVFINFLGHSGGRVWGVDIGSPQELENTDGKLPFVSSVSCNVAGFAEPSSNVLSEDFVLADNRGAIAMWASSSIGFANVGGTLVNYFLEAVAQDTARTLGGMTTASRIRLWQARGSDYITIASVKLNPLIGDPLTNLAIPRKPDLAIPPGGVSSNAARAASGDTALALSVSLRNYGLVPSDSVEISVDDLYAGQTARVLDRLRVPPLAHRDSLTIAWPVVEQKGPHRLTATLDPAGVVEEVDESNNSSTSEEYVYASGALVIRPFDNMVVRAPEVELVLSSVQQPDTGSVFYEFEIDTTSRFDSPVRRSSGSLPSGLYDVRWRATGLLDGLVYFWRVRRTVSGETSQWSVRSFATSPSAPDLPRVRWKQQNPEQFRAQTLFQTAAYDTGVTIRKGEPVHIYARSLGYRADANRDYYSLLVVEEQTMVGLWWVHGSGFLVTRVAPLDSIREFVAFNTPAQASEAEEMIRYIADAGHGDYLAVAVVFDGRTNVSDSLRAALRGLGSVYADSLQPGHAWLLIARKGFGSEYLREQWSPAGVVEDSLQAPSSYALGNGFVRTTPLTVPTAWHRFAWDPLVNPGSTTIAAAIEALRPGGQLDTLQLIGPGTPELDLSLLNGVTGADTTILGIALSASLATSDVAATPILRSWSMDLELPADLTLAAAVRSEIALDGQVAKTSGLELEAIVANLGYRLSDSAEVQVVIPGARGGEPLVRIPLGRLGIDSSTSVPISLPTPGVTGRVNLEVSIVPRAGTRDYLAENNTAVLAVDVVEDPASRLGIFADGIQLMDGDYVALSPRIHVQLPSLGGQSVSPSSVALFVDDLLEGTWPSGPAPEAEDPEFLPALSPGVHRLSVIAVREDLFGLPDTLQEQLTVQVDAEYRIMNLFNYPNPFSSATEITFVLAGGAAPDRTMFRVYTVAGRKIRTIELPPGSATIGFNRVPWDGRDDEGDEIANGTYLYQIEVRAGEKSETATGKLARIR